MPVWARRDPAAASAYLDKLPPGNARQQLVSTLMAGWVQTDPLAATAWASSIANSRARNEVLDAALRAWVDRDPKAAMDYLLAHPGAIRDCGPMLDLWAQKNFADAMAYVSQSKLMQDASAVSAIAFQWAWRDPKGLKDWLATAQLPDARLIEILQRIAEPLVENDVESAVRTMQLVPPGEPAAALYRSFATTLAETDFNRARTWAEAITDPQSKAIAIEVVAAKWSSTDAAAAAVWAKTLPPSLQSEAFQQIIGSWANYEPQAAADFIFKELPQNLVVENLNHLINRWSETDPTLVADWVRKITFPEETQQHNAYTQLINNWMGSDPAAAQRWVGDIPKDDPIHALAIMQVYYGLVQETPQAALKWLTGNLNSQDDGYPQNLAFAAARWARQDPVAARNWFEQTDQIPEAVKQQYRDQFPPASQ